MKKLFFAALGCAALATFSGAPLAQSKGDLEIEKPWARATPPGAAVGGGYLVIRNKGVAADRLVGVSSPASARVEIHEMAMDKDVMRMREVKGVDVPAKKSVELKPGGYHLMLIELKAPLKPGDKVPLTLRFEKAGEVKAELAVGAMTASGPAMKH
jgi:periplasmic copper chaperone A